MEIPQEHQKNVGPLPGSPGYEQHKKWQKQIETARAAAKAQDESLSTADIPDETKKKIRDEFMKMAMNHPRWSRDKVMRKAGEKYNIKFSFE